jgi:membrane protease YdiL (CAAX protease family)
MSVDFDLSGGSVPPVVPPPAHFQPVIPPQATVEEELPEPLPRLKIAWVILLLMFAVLIAGSIGGTKGSSSDKKEPLSEFATKERSIELKVAIRSLAPKSDAKEKAAYSEDIDDLLKDSKVNSEAQKLRVALRVEDREKPFADDLKNLLKSKSDKLQAFAKLYGEEKLDVKTQDSLLSKLGTKSVSERLARVQILEKRGDKQTRNKLFPSEKATGAMLFAILFLGGLSLGIFIWIAYAKMRSEGQWRPLGHVFDKVDSGRADRLALGTAFMIGSFILGSFLSYAPGISKIPGHEIAPVVTVFGTILLIFKFPIAGFRITPQSMGFTTKGIGEQISWGLGAAIANVPVALIMLLFVQLLGNILPGGGHPEADKIISGATPIMIVKILFMASVFAPIWEEIAFRGFLFPAISRVTNKPLVGALLSSFLFAAIHPQGALGVLPLGAIAMMLCAVSYQRRTMISGIVFHAVNNAVLLLLTMTMGKYFN